VDSPRTLLGHLDCPRSLLGQLGLSWESAWTAQTVLRQSLEFECPSGVCSDEGGECKVQVNWGDDPDQ